MAKKKEIKTPTIKEQEELMSEWGLIRYFNKIKKILKEYMDMEEGNYTIVSLWIIGTYLHNQFSSYPYLFFNAMKGSGKTRILKIISNLAKDGKLYLSATKAGIYRNKGTYCLDEFEGVGRKGNEDLRELINGAYKRGGTITRYDDLKKKPEGEEFNLYRPVAMANIWGMENVLSDRCISITLEKSLKKEITRLIEDFEYDTEFKVIRGGLRRITEKFVDDLRYWSLIFSEWNSYVKRRKDVKDIKTLKEEKDTKFKELFESINKTNLEGRDLELFFPLFIIADICGKKILNEVIEISRKIIKERKERDREENTDVQIYEFVAKRSNTEFIAVADLVKLFREDLEISDNQDNWLNTRFFGRGLRRLNLVSAERRTNKRQVRLNIEKAKEKIKLFKEPDFKEELKEVFGDG
jgi:Arc/MetJ-type ribon-helix-helix transcriptional regulator